MDLTVWAVLQCRGGIDELPCIPYWLLDISSANRASTLGTTTLQLGTVLVDPTRPEDGIR